mgnify:CR=1 FL=1
MKLPESYTKFWPKTSQWSLTFWMPKRGKRHLTRSSAGIDEFLDLPPWRWFRPGGLNWSCQSLVSKSMWRPVALAGFSVWQEDSENWPQIWVAWSSRLGSFSRPASMFCRLRSLVSWRGCKTRLRPNRLNRWLGKLKANWVCRWPAHSKNFQLSQSPPPRSARHIVPPCRPDLLPIWALRTSSSRCLGPALKRSLRLT